MISSDALQAHGLQVQLGQLGHSQRPVLQAMDVAFKPGHWTAIVGPNGAGKSTLLRALAGLVPSPGRVTGQVKLLGLDRAHWPRREQAKMLAWLGQEAALVDDLSVQDVVMLGRLPHQPWLAAPSAQDHAAVAQALEAMNLQGWQQRLLGQLSAGERQRVLLARALAVQARVLLLDEPLANLDVPYQVQWLKLMRQLCQQGVTVISVLHELQIALQADELLILKEGRLAHQGASGDADTQAQLQDVFGQQFEVRQVGGQAMIWMKLQ